MEKTIRIEGMSCGHCAAAVENALKAVRGVEGATVQLEQKSATVTLKKDVADKKLIKAVEYAGFTVTEVM